MTCGSSGASGTTSSKRSADVDVRTADLGETFARDGVVVAKGIFGQRMMHALEVEFDQIVARLLRSDEDVNARWESADPLVDGTEAQIVHTHHVQNHSALWMAALMHEPFLDAAEALIGPDIVLHHSKLFQKPASHGAPFPMHQDWRYFPTAEDSMIAAIIHVSPASIDMGCVRAVPGSQSLGRRDSTSGRPIWDDPELYDEFTAEYPIDQAVAYEAEPGDVLFFSYFTVHGSTPNTSDRSRKTVLTQLFSGRDQLDPISEHPVSGLVLRGQNHHATRESVAAQ